MTNLNTSLSPKTLYRPLKLGVAAGLLYAAASGCGLIDIPITLQTQTFKQNFGNGSGTVMTVNCTTAADPCTAAANQVQSSLGTTSPGTTVTGACDTSTSPGKCTAQVNATVSYTLNLSQDSSFVSGVGGKAVAVVKSISLKYGVPKNALSFAIPELSLYIAPSGVTDITKATFIDKIPSIPAGKTSADGSAAITVQTSSPAGQLFVNYIKNPSTPFNLLINTKPVLKAGDPIPSGEIWINVTPEIIVGF